VKLAFSSGTRVLWLGAFDWPETEFFLVCLWGISGSKASLTKDLTEKLQKQKVIAHFYVKIYLQLARGLVC
jgi:hypothetical protein